PPSARSALWARARTWGRRAGAQARERRAPASGGITNLAQVAFDALGRVTKAAVLGKGSPSEGDTLDDPTVRYTYALDRWDTTAGQKPGYVKTEHREQHGSANTRWLTSYAFFDGAGGVALMKGQAAPETSGGDPRWVASGRTVVNNKGNPI